MLTLWWLNWTPQVFAAGLRWCWLVEASCNHQLWWEGMALCYATRGWQEPQGASISQMSSNQSTLGLLKSSETWLNMWSITTTKQQWNSTSWSTWGSAIRKQSTPRLWRLVSVDEIMVIASVVKLPWITIWNLNLNLTGVLEFSCAHLSARTRKEKNIQYPGFFALLGKERLQGIKRWDCTKLRCMTQMASHPNLYHPALPGQEPRAAEGEDCDRPDGCQRAMSVRWSQDHTWNLWLLVTGNGGCADEYWIIN